MDAERQRVIELRLTRERIEQRVHELAAQGEVAFSGHALDRMEERDISDIQVIRVLKRGDLRGEVEAGTGKGEWKCKIVDTGRGAREIGVVTLLIKNRRLFVKTVEWEDMR